MNRNDMEVLCCSKVFSVDEIEYITGRFENLDEFANFSASGKLAFCVSYPLAGDVVETGCNMEKLFRKSVRFAAAKIDVLKRLEAIRLREDLKLILYQDDSYPWLLRNIPDPPAFLFAKGDMGIVLSERVIACVGSRKHTNYGKYAVEKIVSGLCENGFGIVSGMAYGIDSLCHAECLKGGGKTAAVLGCGVDVVYPESNRTLYRRMVSEGLILSEYFPDEKPKRYYFPERNRIISGLAKGVVVFEAGIRSGSLITATCALEQNREVFAVPGQINSAFSEGTNLLIKKGAKLVSRIEDILEEFGMRPEKATDNPKILAEGLTETERHVYELISYGYGSIDALVEKTGATVSELNSSVSMLMVNGLIDGDGNNLNIKK